MEGEAGNDTLKGGLGVDILEGGLGADVMFGEGDEDYFLYRIYDKASWHAVGNDIINGFQTGIDKIELTTCSNSSASMPRVLSMAGSCA